MLEKPILKGENVTLRPITPDDAPLMHSALSDEESMRLTGTQASYTLEQVEAFCKMISSLDADDRADFAITLPDDPTYIGEAVLNNIDWDNRGANFRIAMASHENFGKGYGTEATRLILKYGFENLELQRIELEVFDFNPRAQHVYEKVGFVKEGVRRNVLLWEGQYQSAVIMSILADEYKATSL